MYIKPTRGYYKGTSQCSSRQWFLIMCTPGKKVKAVLSDYEYYLADYPQSDRIPIRCIVRKVALEQLGHFMMGYARAFNYVLPISGGYGNMGLPTDVDREVWDKAIPLPDNLYDAWNKGEGWNSCGSEAPLMREWAINNFEILAPKGATL